MSPVAACTSFNLAVVSVLSAFKVDHHLPVNILSGLTCWMLPKKKLDQKSNLPFCCQKRFHFHTKLKKREPWNPKRMENINKLSIKTCSLHVWFLFPFLYTTENRQRRKFKKKKKQNEIRNLKKQKHTSSQSLTKFFAAVSMQISPLWDY